MNPMFQQQETGGRLMGRMWGTFVPGVLGELGQVALVNSAIFCFFLVSPGSRPEPVALCGRSSRSKSKFGGAELSNKNCQELSLGNFADLQMICWVVPPPSNCGK